jgi:hypothetical protein
LELLGLIEDYRQGLLKHHLNRYPDPSGCLCPAQRRVHQQVYLHPYPKELMLRNRVQVQALWPPEADEALIVLLITSLQLWHVGPQKRALLKG